MFGAGGSWITLDGPRDGGCSATTDVSIDFSYKIAILRSINMLTLFLALVSILTKSFWLSK